VAVWLTYSDGSSLTRNTDFVYEDGERRHRFRQQDIEGKVLPFRCHAE
jgi:hypothetical protein